MKQMHQYLLMLLNMLKDLHSQLPNQMYISDILREGARVRVKSGSFAGVEGTVIRVKRSRRVMVELPGMLAIATTFVKPEELEIL